MSDNLKHPAYPTKTYNSQGGDAGHYEGFTKLEKAALMIASGFTARVGIANSPGEWQAVAALSVDLAKAVLEEANK